MNDKWEILHGDALKLLGGFAPGTFDAVITDPPYASGGRTQAEKNKSTAKKYSSMGDHAPPPFDGDAKDQRSWTRWAAEWLGDARKICKPGAPVCMFIDWRQLPAATDALQWAGWIWRGTAVWDKGNSRPQKGRFRQQAEYIVWGSNGDMPINRPVPCLPGVFKYGNPQNRIHLTEKPLPLMRDVVKITEPGGHILDPFAGSGTTILAAVLEGYTATGIEVTGEYARRARERIKQVLGYIEEHYGEEFDISQAAGMCFYSQSHFMKYFKQYTGQPFVSYLNDYRLSRAGGFLRTTGDTVTEIAVRCGFDNLSYFNRLFRRKYGMTPKEYRES